MRSRLSSPRVALGILPLIAALALTAYHGLALAATPSGGTIGPANPSINWVGQLYGAAATPVPDACPPATDPANLRCDHFLLNVNVAPGYWDTHTGGADITITWDSADNDFDLYVYDANGTEVGRSASGGTTSERVFVQSPAGTYEVRVVPFLVVASGYNGTAAFVSQDGSPTPNPSRSSGGLAFAPATVVDAQRTEGEPINWIDKDGNYWESGPWGTSTQQSFIHRSTDGGDQFHVVSPINLRPDLPPGGGDTDIVTDDQGYAYWTDLEGLVKIEGAVSNDGGNSWRKNPAAEATSVDDRQWFAIDNGTTGAATDNTVFLVYRNVGVGSYIYSTPGSTGATDPVGGLVYINSSVDPINPVNTGAPCGQMRFDPVRRNLYYPCAAGDHIQLTVGHVDPGQRTGITYTTVATPPSPGGAVGDIFPGIAIDKAGNIYAVWVDENDHNVYYAYSTDQGQHWSDVRQINGNDANSNVFPWAIAGDNGTLAVAWYGSPSRLDSDLMPSWYNNRQAAAAYKWYGYVSLIQNAAGSAPTYLQQRFTDKPMHYGQICNSGTLCLATGGDRTMADFFAITFDREGALRFIYNDTTSQHHGAHLFEVRQIAGPSGYGTTLSKAVPKSPVSDPTGDAQSPHYSPVTGAGPSLPQFDFTQLKLSQPNATTLRVQMSLNSLASLTPPAGKTSSVWYTRFQALSQGDEGEEAYRIFYVGAESVGGTAPTFFAGSGTSAQDAVPGTGCTPNTPENCKIVQYPSEVPAQGSIAGNTITIDVPIQGGFGANRPIFGDTLYYVTALSAGRNNAATDIYAELDATRSFNFILGTIEPPPPDDGGKGAGSHITGGGSIPGSGTSEGRFALNVFENGRGKVDYRDTGVNFRATRITSATFNDATKSAEIKGTGVNGNHMVDFTLNVVDGGASGATDRFSIQLSDGYSRSGTLTSGNLQYHQ